MLRQARSFFRRSDLKHAALCAAAAALVLVAGFIVCRSGPQAGGGSGGRGAVYGSTSQAAGPVLVHVGGLRASAAALPPAPAKGNSPVEPAAAASTAGHDTIAQRESSAELDAADHSDRASAVQPAPVTPPAADTRVEGAAAVSNSNTKEEHAAVSSAPVRTNLTGNHPEQQTNIIVYLEDIRTLNSIYVNKFAREEAAFPAACPMPHNSKCFLQHTNTTGADVRFRLIGNYFDSIKRDKNAPFRYCDRQIVAMLNSETESPPMKEPMKRSDIRIDHHPSSAVSITEACSIPWKPELYKTPDPKGRKGVAVLVSNCGATWRSKFILEVAKYIHIYSYGGCWHNVSVPASRNKYGETFSTHASKHRVVIAFENMVQSDYITEKLSQCFNAGVIPVYWGAPEIYQWIPGNHSIIDASKFKSPKEVAEYLKRIDEDDDLFRYHTTNFDYTLARKTHEATCASLDTPYMCLVCRAAQKIKIQRRKEGLVPATCLP